MSYKNIFQVLLGLASMFWILLGCSDRSSSLGTFELLPQVQELQINGISKINPHLINNIYIENDEALEFIGGDFVNMKLVSDKTKAKVVGEINGGLDVPDQGYVLNISEHKVLLQAKNEAGLFYAFQSLQQLIDDAKDQNVSLPMCKIRDYPLLLYRAIHLDVKHHLETKDYYYSLIDRLASYKINGIIIEIEDKLKFDRHPIIASKDAWTKEEWRQLSEYAHERFIEISPLVQGLGHSSFVLKHQEYAHLRDDPKSDWAYNPLDPDTYKLQYDMYDEALEAFPHGKYLHVGGDEVHTTGRGSARSQLDLQLEWLNKVCIYAEENGKVPIFWDDMPLNYAGLYHAMFDTILSEAEVAELWVKNAYKLEGFLDRFPKNCVYMRWNYHAPQTPGNTKAMDWFRSNGLQVMGATAGQTRWVLMPQRESNIDNILAFAKSSIGSKAEGLLLTLWDDDSPHFELYMRGILAFAEGTWSGDKRSKEEIKKIYRSRTYSNSAAGESYAFIDALEGPVGKWKNLFLNGNSRNYLKSNKAALDKLVIDVPDPLKPGEWSEKYAERINDAEGTIHECDTIAHQIQELKAITRRNHFNLEVYDQVNKLVMYSNELLLLVRDYDSAESEDEQAEIKNRLKIKVDMFSELWSNFKEVYGRSRVLEKPENYILDQDKHVHLANQDISFDWQIFAELLFIEKLNQSILKAE